MAPPSYVVSMDSRVCVCMVGLPARGKTYIAQKICRYLKWLSIPTEVFNVGNYRRTHHDAHPTASFFDPKNSAGEKARREAAMAAVKDMVNWFNKGGVVGILDATNTTRERRQWIARLCNEANVQLMFVESVCEDEDLIIQNIMDVKLSSPDYSGQDPEEAARDFRERIKMYEAVYESIDEKDLTYVKLVNVGSQVVINMIKDYLQSRIVYYLMNLHIKPRSIYLSRHGESQFNLEGKIGGDAPLSERGMIYAQRLPNIISSQIQPGEKLTVWTSTLRRTIQTAEGLPYRKLQWKALDELDAGVCDGLTYEEIEDKYPEDFAARDGDKYNYRYRGGESYRDVVVRLEPVMMELERQENVFIVCHQAILRCIYGYFLNIPQEELPFVDMPLHTVIKLTPKAYRCVEERISANIPAVSTHRAKGAPATFDKPVECEVKAN
ncbi:Fructose-2,6-bisphosphatase [Saitoella coloradoensis]